VQVELRRVRADLRVDHRADHRVVQVGQVGHRKAEAEVVVPEKDQAKDWAEPGGGTGPLCELGVLGDEPRGVPGATGPQA